jgi:hypothetical protein
MTERCTIVRLRLDDLDREAGDPKLAALLGEGWQIAESLAISEEDGPPSWVLLLSPPRGEAREQEIARTSEQGSPIPFAALLALASGIAGLAIGILLA